MKRRTFIKGAAAIAAAAGGGDILRAAEMLPTADGKASDDRIIASAPMLQNFAETSIGVAFAVNHLANGYVLIGKKPDLSDARKVLCGGYRLCDIDDKVVQIRITGLKPSTKYYYRIGADRIHYVHGHNMKVTGTEEDPTTYSFTTAGAALKSGRFCVINDTHKKWVSFGPIQDKLAAIAPSCVIWNGDASNSEETIENQIEIYLNPLIGRKDYAARTPYLFCPGNHDLRGWANRHLEKVWMYRQAEERSVRDWDLGRNFAVRLGDTALIGLDTAEDKLDTNPIFAGIFKSREYREAQTLWLRDALKRKDIASAPNLVAFCHIPLWDDDPTHNPGDVAPADYDPRYTADYAYWQRTCHDMWGPLLEKARCQALITAHMHRFRIDSPGPGHKWTQIVGGGPELKESIYPTVIEGWADKKGLHIRVHNILSGQVQANLDFKPRR